MPLNLLSCIVMGNQQNSMLKRLKLKQQNTEHFLFPYDLLVLFLKKPEGTSAQSVCEHSLSI